VRCVYLNGEYVPADEATIPALDAGVLFGRGVFETFRARRGSVYRLDQHLQRLKAGAKTLSIPLPQALAELPAIVRELARQCELVDARVRLTLTAGAEGGDPSLLIEAKPVTGYPPTMYERGAAAVIASVRRNETSPLAGVKTLNYTDNVLAREAAGSEGADEAIMLNGRGLIADGSAFNVFAVRDGQLRTPTVEDGALPGVTRGAVLELASEAGIAAEETALTPDDLQSADEAFLTNAIVGVMPLVSVDGGKIGDGRPGPLTQQVKELYERDATG
jgi:branched-subunit amino acid aminotransferase/4-amino-4-deoxychorismate lyase